jgi:MSHA biogenesis protein MshK
MDETVTPTTMKPALGAAFLALFLCGAAHAQAMQDPTKPPPAATPVAAGPLAASSGPQLQSILIGRAAGGRHVAVIDGETVRQGESFHGAKVARIGANEVELVRGRERQVLRLFAEAGDGIKGDHAATVTVRR